MKDRPTTQEKIVNLFARSSPLHESIIADVIETNPESVRVELYNLQKKGIVGKSKTEGYWYIVDTEVKEV